MLVLAELGGESISAIKIWFVLPISMAFMFVYIKLSDIFSRSKLFHLMNWFFISYFVLFAFVLYPRTDYFLINFGKSGIFASASLKYILPIISRWHYALFYAFAEMWVTIMLSISLWQAVNHVTNLEESKRFYPILGVIAQFGLMIASILAKSFVVPGEYTWQLTLNKITISIVVAGVLLSFFIARLTSIVSPEVFNGKVFDGENKARHRISLVESLKTIFSSKPILMITTMLFCYNFSMNLMEGVWKKSVELFLNNDANGIQRFMGDVSFWVSIFSILFAMIGMYIIRKYKWLVSALISPCVFMLTGMVFFCCLIFKDNLLGIVLSFSLSKVAAYGGAIHVIFTRSTKNTIFDVTKEMSYIPLETTLKTKGKAAAELIGMRFGKGCGSLVQQILLMLCLGSSLLDLAPAIFIIFMMSMICWIYAILALNKFNYISTKNT